MSRSLNLCSLALLSVVLAGACVAEEGADLGERQAFIVNGTIDNGHPAVGIVHSAGAAACTGTLIAPDKVLTAAHCVLTKTTPYQYLQPINFYLGGFYGQQYTATSVLAHPSYSGGNKSDLAVIWLGQNITSVSPYPIATATEVPKKYESITMVGYGLIGENLGQFGTKRKATNTINQVYQQVFSFDGASGTKSTVCSGDSGGPTFATRNGKETVIGVHSTSEQGCQDQGFDMRVDAFYQWITTQQVTKRTYGQLCASGSDCISGLCIPAGNGSNDAYCTQGCDSQACPSADDCVNVSGAPGISKACIPHTGGNNKVGEPCSSHPECASGICIDVPGEGTICSQRCDLTTQDCPTKFTCVNSSWGGLCIPGGAPPPQKKKNGEICVDHAECDSGICALHDTQRKCSAQCNPGSCPGGYDCKPVGGTSKSACVAQTGPKAKLGEPCKAHSECESSICAPIDGGTCIEMCDPNAAAPCPSGFRCAPVAGSSQGACVKEDLPKGGLGSPCTAHEQCQSNLCASSGSKQWCTQKCDDQGCPQGYDCVDAGGTKICAPGADPEPTPTPEDSGGCAVDQGQDPSTALLLLWLLPIIGLIRRSRR